MDVPLYVIALLTFAILYLVLGVFLVYALFITLIFLFLYLAIRYGNMSESYPQGFGDVMITIIFIGVTWAIFILFGPKSPVPFVGSGLTYTAATAVPINAVIGIGVVFSIVMLIIFSFAYYRGDRMGGTNMASTSDRDKPKQGVGS
ncbi:MAG: hypothetical protein L3K04_03035 [Thermoplasmata archaeon]|nr:hypothetical protein [Thermoplasmata archaeon]MCI4338289.1 hypothetical protein [Thermoplasmata archaeon]MCI4341421.1 hypothetical protein [Thermoplasmata archaeon]